MDKQTQLNDVIQGLRSAISELREVLIASTDGLAIAHSHGASDPNRVAAMAAATLGVGKRISTTLDLGEMRETTVKSANGQAFLYAIGGKGVLVLIAQSEANVGLINLEARDAAAKLEAVL